MDHKPTAKPSVLTTFTNLAHGNSGNALVFIDLSKDTPFALQDAIESDVTNPCTAATLHPMPAMASRAATTLHPTSATAGILQVHNSIQAATTLSAAGAALTITSNENSQSGAARIDSLQVMGRRKMKKLNRLVGMLNKHHRVIHTHNEFIPKGQSFESDDADTIVAIAYDIIASKKLCASTEQSFLKNIGVVMKDCCKAPSATAKEVLQLFIAAAAIQEKKNMKNGTSAKTNMMLTLKDINHLMHCISLQNNGIFPVHQFQCIWSLCFSCIAGSQSCSTHTIAPAEFVFVIHRDKNSNAITGQVFCHYTVLFQRHGLWIL